MSVQRIVEDAPPIDLQAEAQHATGEVEEPVSNCSVFKDSVKHKLVFVNSQLLCILIELVESFIIEE